MSRTEREVWEQDLLLLRKEKDEWMRSNPDSPIPHEIRHRMNGLEYFPPDFIYRFKVKLAAHAKQERVVMTTSKGQQREFLRYGRFEFEIDGTKQTLQAYRSVPSYDNRHEEESLFVPFRDATSGKETYGAARYIDLEFSPSGEYILDFNLAYNPYCAYSEDYVCPFPPPENWLKVPILAGEKAYRKE